MTALDPASAPDMGGLAALAGLEMAAGQLAPLVTVLRAEQARRTAGIAISRPAWKNLVITGSPGTGKSRAASAIARLYRDLGVLSYGNLIELHAADLVGATARDTATQIREAVKVTGDLVMITGAHAWHDLPGQGQHLLRCLYQHLTEARKYHGDELAIIRYAFVSNSDNLGALADVRIAAWLAAEQVPFALEAVRGTLADRKGGHLARYQGRLVLRETAQVPDGDTSFTDMQRWRWYNTNNIWIDLRALAELQAADPAAPSLPLIVNRKTVDPRDPASIPVIQLESAMGAAIGSIPGARALHVPRSRFAPVKTTDDLLVVRSDAYELTGDGRMSPGFDGPGPVVTLDKDFYKLLSDFGHRFPAGPPSLRRCRRFEVEGDVTFGAGVVAVGEVRMAAPRHVPDGEVLVG